MEYRQHARHPLIGQHVIHVDRRTLLKQATSRHTLWSDRVAISINDTAQEEQEMRGLIIGTPALFLSFADDEQGMTEAQAQAIRSFVDAHADRSFLVHCFLGVSRSAAVAKWINEYLDLNDAEQASYKGYNRHVYGLLSRDTVPYDSSW